MQFFRGPLPSPLRKESGIQKRDTSKANGSFKLSQSFLIFFRSHYQANIENEDIKCSLNIFLNQGVSIIHVLYMTCKTHFPYVLAIFFLLGKHTPGIDFRNLRVTKSDSNSDSSLY